MPLIVSQLDLKQSEILDWGRDSAITSRYNIFRKEEIFGSIFDDVVVP